MTTLHTVVTVPLPRSSYSSRLALARNRKSSTRLVREISPHRYRPRDLALSLFRRNPAPPLRTYAYLFLHLILRSLGLPKKASLTHNSHSAFPYLDHTHPRKKSEFAFFFLIPRKRKRKSKSKSSGTNANQATKIPA